MRRLVQGFFPLAGAILGTSALLGFWGTAFFKAAPGWGFVFTARDWVPPSLLGLAGPLLGSALTALGGFALGAGCGFLAARALVFDPPPGAGAFRALFSVGGWVPSVALGLVAVQGLLPALRAVGLGSGYGLLAGALVLGILALPQATLLFSEALVSMPREIAEGALALGGRPQQIGRLLGIAACRRPLVGQALALLARLIGESAAVALVVGNNGLWPPSLTAPSTTMSAVLLTEGGGAPGGGPWAAALWSGAVLLLAVSALLAAGARRWAGAR